MDKTQTLVKVGDTFGLIWLYFCIGTVGTPIFSGMFYSKIRRERYNLLFSSVCFGHQTIAIILKNCEPIILFKHLIQIYFKIHHFGFSAKIDIIDFLNLINPLHEQMVSLEQQFACTTCMMMVHSSKPGGAQVVFLLYYIEFSTRNIKPYFYKKKMSF